MTHDSHHLLGPTLAMLRGYVASFAVRAAIDVGLFDLLEAGATRDQLRAAFACEDRIVDALVAYLDAERLIERRSDDLWILTETGRQLSRQRGWFRLFVGGYAGVLARLPDLLTGRVSGDLRDLAAVAQGSGDISEFDAIPLAARLIAESARPCHRILDVGCGNARLLCGVLDRVDTAVAVAVDPSADALDAARRTIAGTRHAGRVELIHGDIVQATANIDAPDWVIAAFVLQEVHGQSGRAATVAFLRDLGERWPRAHWIVIEVDHQPTAEVLRTPHGLGYYNGYYLLHPLTRQELLPRALWEEIFDEAGFVVDDVKTTDPSVDATGLELGFRLARR